MTTTQDMKSFFARSDVKALQEIQKANPWGSEKHKEASMEIRRLASLVGAQSFFGDSF